MTRLLKVSEAVVAAVCKTEMLKWCLLLVQVVLLSSHIDCDDFVVRNFTIRNVQSGELRNVTQFQFLSWPSAGPSVPESTKSLLDFRR